MEHEIDISRLRRDLEDYYGTAKFSGFSLAVMDVSKVERMSAQELVELAHSLPGLNGILINPYTDGFTLVQEQLEIMLETEPSWKEAFDKERASHENEE